MSASPAVPTPPTCSARRWGRNLEWFVLMAAVVYLVGILIAQMFQRDPGVATLVLGSGDSGVVQQLSTARRSELIVQPGRHRFQLLGYNIPPGHYVLQFHRTMFDALNVRQPAVGSDRTEHFFQPERSFSGEVSSFFEFPVQVFSDGSLLLDVETVTSRKHMASMQLVTPETARRLERRSSMSSASRYGTLLMLTVLLLVVHLSTGERTSLTYVWMTLGALLILLMVGGHLYMLPGLRWIGEAGESGVAGMRMLFVIAALRLTMLMAYGDAMPRALVPWYRAGMAALIALCLLMISGLWPARLLTLDVLAWGTAGMAIMIGSLRFQRMGVPYARWIVASIAAVLFLAVVNEWADSGRMSGVHWTLRSLQLSLTVLCSLIGLSLVRRLEAYRQALQYAEARAAEAEEQAASYRQSSETDMVTGVASQRLWYAKLRTMLEDTPQVPSAQLALMLVDIDRFQEIVARHGRAAGDEILRDVAARMSQVLRSIDTLARLSGGEFAVLAPGLGEREAVSLLGGRLRLVVANHDCRIGGETVLLRAAIGAAIRREGENEASELIERADDALQRARKAGSNCVVID